MRRREGPLGGADDVDDLVRVVGRAQAADLRAGLRADWGKGRRGQK